MVYFLTEKVRKKEYDIDVNKDEPLTIAIGNCNTDIMKFLFNCEGKDLNETSSGFSTLIEAVETHDKEIVVPLLSHPEIDVNIQNKDGSPLDLVLHNYKKDKKIIKDLISHKNIIIRNKEMEKLQKLS